MRNPIQVHFADMDDRLRVQEVEIADGVLSSFVIDAILNVGFSFMIGATRRFIPSHRVLCVDSLEIED